MDKHPTKIIELLPRSLSSFFISLTATEACCKTCDKKVKYSSKASSNLITHLKRCSPSSYREYRNGKRKHQDRMDINENDIYFPTKSLKPFTSNDDSQKALTKALIKSIACDQLPVNIVDSETFRSLLLIAEPRYVIPSCSTVSNILIPTVAQQMEEAMRQEIACLSQAYLTIDLKTNRNLTSYLSITISFINNEWKLRSLVLAVDTFAGRYTAESIARVYNNTVEKFELTAKVTKVIADTASSMAEAFEASLPQFTLHQAEKEIKKQNQEASASVFEHDKWEDLNALLIYLPERENRFANALQLCIKDCLQDAEFVKSPISQQLQKIANIINSMRKSANAISYLQHKTWLRTHVHTRWDSQLNMLQSVLKDCEEVNQTLGLIQSSEKITKQDYLELTELINVLLPFKEALLQVEGNGIVTTSCICPIVVGLLNAMEQFKKSNTQYCKNLAVNLKKSVSKRLLSFLNSPDYRLASLLDPRFKNKWIEDDLEKEEAVYLLKTHAASKFINQKAESLGTEEVKHEPKKPKLFDFLGLGFTKKKPYSAGEVEKYIEEETVDLDEDPLMYWKKKSKQLPTLAALAKEYLGLTATSARIFPSAGNFHTDRHSNTAALCSLTIIKCNATIFGQVQL